MSTFLKTALTLGSMLLCLSTAHSTSIPNTDHPTTFLGPTAKLGYTTTITNTTAYSLLGEAGIKNFRVGGTLGWLFAENQRFKVSGEYLWQKITYAFFSGNSDQWVQQGALGAAYQYDFGFDYNPQFDLSAYVSRAPSKSLSTQTGTFTNAQGVIVPFVDNRRIAGSNAAGISPGLSIAPWQGGRIGAELNYDNVRYDTHSNSVNEDAKGFGGTIKLSQALTENLVLDLSAAVRQPFNNYAADLDWTHIQFNGDWTLGIFGDYTDGKNTLPNTWNLGVSANYFLDQRCPVMVPANLKGERNLKGEINLKGEMIAQPITDNLLGWTTDPAVYMPQVLAIVDVPNDPCSSPVRYIGPARPPFPVTDLPFTFNMAPLFTGSPIRFSMSVSASAGGSASDFSINPNSGLVTYTGSGGLYNITITGTNACGNASVNFVYNNNTL